MILMIKNAHYFNEPGSVLHKKASTMRKFIISKGAELWRKYQLGQNQMQVLLLPQEYIELALCTNCAFKKLNLNISSFYLFQFFPSPHIKLLLVSLSTFLYSHAC